MDQKDNGGRAEASGEGRGRRTSQSQTVSAAKLVLPRFEIPSLRLPLEIAPSLERWNEALRPLQELGERLQAQLEAFQRTMAPMRETVRRLQLESKRCERLEAVGWLPHLTSPFQLVEEETEDMAALDAAIESFYRTEWSRISNDLVDDMATCGLDHEAQAAFAEAIAAHGAGLYRCAPRLLYPEIERVTRLELHGGAMDKMASVDRLREAIGGLSPAEMSSTGITGLRLYMKLTQHLYAHVKNPEALQRIMEDPVPNRHAAVHGYVPYRSFKSSLNAIIIADYLLQAIATLKNLSEDGV